jgi:hypothetical protein
MKESDHAAVLALKQRLQERFGQGLLQRGCAASKSALDFSGNFNCDE